MAMSASRILPVEDDPEQADLFAQVLALKGYDVETAPDAEVALACLRDRWHARREWR